MGISLYSLLEVRARRASDEVVIGAPGRAPLTYGRLLRVAWETVETLNGMGVGRNDRVALVLPDGPELAVAFLAVAAGATTAPLDPAYTAAEFAFYLGDLGARAL